MSQRAFILFILLYFLIFVRSINVFAFYDLFYCKVLDLVHKHICA